MREELGGGGGKTKKALREIGFSLTERNKQIKVA